jgi:chromosomal replication initiation ATPase DnaA
MGNFRSFTQVIEHAASLFEISSNELLAGGKHPQTVKARSVACYWGNREPGMSTIELSKKMNISQPSASQSVRRGQKIVQEEKLEFLE